jgi:ABC-2 type transport system ATP-binding protein
MAPADTPVVLRITDLAKSFGDVSAVDGLSLEIHRGEIFGFLGPNGAGKTTTIRMMCGLLESDSGSIEILSGSSYLSKSLASSMIGLSPQAIVIWETLTCLEQLEFMGRMYNLDRALARRRSEELLEVFGLQDKRNKLGKTLSGGMQRRLNIALALVHQPEILFLDEPQAGLDPQSRVLVRDYIRGLSGQTTVILTTHDMEEAEKLSDRVCIIDYGRLLVLDTVERIKGRLSQGELIEIELAEGTSPVPFEEISIGGELYRFSQIGGTAADSPAPPPVPSPEEANRPAFTVRGSTLSLITTKAAEILPEILEAIEGRGWKMDHIRIRPKTLEDVFIHLTGRGLRE